MPTITINIANRGTLLADGGTSAVGHMWYTLTADNGSKSGYGFSPDASHEGEPFAPGTVDAHGQDDNYYTTTDYTRTIEITQAQYDQLKAFGEHPENFGFNMYYNGLWNSCIDFTWSALIVAGLSPPGFYGDIWPTSNEDDADWIGDPDDFFSRGQDMFHKAQQTVSPLILDLDGDGVETISIESGIHFDHDANGLAEQTGWAGKDDGLLVRDLDGNGLIDNGHELFGNNTLLSNGGYASNGFAALADLDNNHDGKISSADTAFSQLRIWKDSNSNGVTDAGELLTLDQAAIQSIDLSYFSRADTDQNDNIHQQQGDYTTSAGVTLAIHDVWFSQGTVDVINTSAAPVSAEIAALPDVDGRGAVQSLHDSMAGDATGHLQSLVTAYVSETDPVVRATMVDALIYAWAGVEDVSPTSRGSYFPDARKLAALEAFWGNDFIQGSGINAGTGSPGPNSTELLLAAYNELAASVSSALLSSTQHAVLYAGSTMMWNAESSKLEWDVSGTIAALQSAYSADAASGTQLIQEFGSALSHMSDSSKSLLEKLRASGSILDTGFSYALASMGFDNVVVGTSGNDSQWGQTGSDLMVGGDGNDTLSGDIGDDVIRGGNGNDQLRGYDGNDVIDGGAGDDQLSGGDDRYVGGFPTKPLSAPDGDDTFIYGRGGGHDTIHQVGAYGNDEDPGLNDVIQFSEGVDINDLVLTAHSTEGTLSINFRNADGTISTTDSLTIEGYFLADFFYDPYDNIAIAGSQNNYGVKRSIASFKFADSGEIYTAAELEALVLPVNTSGGDFIDGTSGNDLINSLGGTDTIFAGDGDDTVVGGTRVHGGSGNDDLKGGALLLGEDGDDTLEGTSGSKLIGGAGSDTYVYNLGDGNVYIGGLFTFDTAATSIDTLQFGVGIQPDDITVVRGGGGSNYDAAEIVVTNSATGAKSSITIYNALSTTYGSSVLDQVRFSDGTVWTREDFYARFLTGSSGDDIIDGFDRNDVINGNGGDDKLYGEAGNDEISGGAGNDALYGGAGDDTYHFGRNQGHDEILDAEGVNKVLLDAGISTADVTLYRTSSASRLGSDTADQLVLKLNTGEQLWIRSFYNTGTSSPVSEIAFADGTIWDAATMAAQTVDVSGVQNSASGTSSDDVFTVDHRSDVVTEAANSGNDTIQSSVTYTLPANVEKLVLTGSLDINGTGNALDNTIVGNSAANILDGGQGVDTLSGGAGDDIYILGNESTATSGTVDTVVEASNEGYDTIVAYAYTAVLSSNVEAMVVESPQVSLPIINGWGPSQSYVGNDLNNLIDASQATAKGYGFTIDGGAGADTMIGPSGPGWSGTAKDPIIRYVVDNVGDVVVGGSQTTDLVQTTISYVLPTSVERIELAGSTAISATGNALDNVLDGSKNSASNLLIGGLGNDTYIVDASDVIQEDANGGIDTVQSSDLSYSLADKPNIENLTLLGDWNSNGYGNAADNVIRGTSRDINLGLFGNNILDGGAGNDTLYGEGQSDTLYGGDGNDILYGDSYSIALSLHGNDYLDGGAGADAMYGFGGNDVFIVDNVGDTVIENANEGTDTVQSSVTFTLSANIETLILTGGAAIDGTGNELDNTLTGNTGDNVLLGLAGNDVLDGGSAGSDTLIGGVGDDTYIVTRSTGISIVESANEGTDTVRASTSYTLANNVENLILTGGNAISGTGNALNNSLDGSQNTAANVLAGGVGDDTYVVGSGDTVLESSNEGVDTVLSSINYTLDNNVENLTLTADYTWGIGNTLNNVITGNAGTNYLDGGAGDDQLIGGFGNDAYVGFGLGSGNDVIIDSNGSSEIDFAESTLRIDDLQFSRSGDDLKIGISASDSITVQNWFTTAGNRVNTLYLTENGENFRYTEDQIESRALGVNSAPVSWGSLVEIDTEALYGFSYQLPANSFIDIESQHSLTYNATLSDGSALPSWLTFDTATRTFSGTAPVDFVGVSYDVTVTATDAGGLSASTDLIFDVTPPAIRGTNGNDVLNGDAGDNIIYGLDGDDTLNGLDGNDQIFGDAGNDSSFGGSGDDYIDDYEGGNDLLDGGAGVDEMYGGQGDDTYVVDNVDDYLWEEENEGVDTVKSSISYTLGDNVENLTLTGTAALDGTGNELDDVIVGNSGSNTLIGDVGNDTLDGGSAGTDSLRGGVGDDIYIINRTSGVTIVENANEGTDTVQSSVTYTLGSNVENLVLTGTTAINGTGNSLANIVTGNSANNTLSGGTGADQLLGGAGNDTYVIDNVGDVVTENANEGTDLIQSSVTYALSANVENLTLTGTAAVDGTGNTLDNVLTGNSAANTLIGGAGNDTLSGGTGADTMLGGTGNDTYVVDNTADVTTENANEGTDLVQSSVTYTLSSNVENLTLTGTSAINGTGNTLDNILTGNSANNTLTGGAGNDTLDGGSGSDTMIGGTGDDTYVVAQTGDVVTENASEGTDVVQSSVTYTIGSNVENLTLTGTSAINGTGNTLDNILTGNSANNTLTGSAGNDTLNGGAGTDTMVGGTGNDVYYVDVSADVTTENANEGIDTVNSSVTRTLASNIELLFLTGTTAINGTGNALANLLRGNTANNTLAGGGGTDILEGGDGNDTLSNTSGNTLLNGGLGTDTLTGTSNNDLLIGGAGNDALATGSGADIIAFNKGDGQDTVAASTPKDNTLSVGGGAAYADLLFQKSGNDLILKVGASDQITFTNYYASTSNHSVNTLQVVLEGSSDYNAGSSDGMYNKKIESFNFDGLVSAFDAARAANPSLTTWALSGALAAQYLSGSDTAAMGGDLAYQYGRYGNESNISFTPAMSILGSASFGTSAQTLQSLASLQDSTPRLS